MNRKYEKLKNNPGIYRIWNWCDKKKKRIEPKSGNRFGVKYRMRSELGKLVDRRKTFKTFKEAKEFKLNVGEPQVSEPKLEESKSQMTFGELTEKWKELWLPNKAVATQIRYVRYLIHYKTIWNLEVESIDASAVDHLITSWKQPEYLAGNQKTRCDFDHEFNILRSIFKFYVSRINRNYHLPFVSDHRTMLKVKERPKKRKDLTLTELESFFQCLKKTCERDQLLAIYYLAQIQYGTYSRVQSAAALHYEDFDLDRNIVTINKKVIWTRVPTRDDFIDTGTKKNGGLVIPLSKMAKDAFLKWSLVSGIRSGPLFLIEGKLLSYRQIEYRYSKALKQAGIPQSATHVLRHASLSEAYDVSKDLMAVQNLAGHSNYQTTTKYAKSRDSKIVAVQDEMDQRMSSILK